MKSSCAQVGHIFPSVGTPGLEVRVLPGQKVWSLPVLYLKRDSLTHPYLHPKQDTYLTTNHI